MNLGTFQCGAFTLTVIGHAHHRAKRWSLRLNALTRQLKLTLPPHQPLEAIQHFIQSHLHTYQEWIEKKIEATSKPPSLLERDQLLLNGVPYIFEQNRLFIKPFICDKSQTIFLPQQTNKEDLYHALKLQAELKLIPIAEFYAKELKITLKKTLIKNMTSRWGSCSSSGRISLNWRLLLAPPEVARYVCAHEVCHLIHFDHSKAFWALVKQLCPTYQQDREWLRHNGPALMSL